MYQSFQSPGTTITMATEFVLHDGFLLFMLFIIIIISIATLKLFSWSKEIWARLRAVQVT